MKRAFAAAVSFCVLVTAWHGAALAEAKYKFGWLEKVKLYPGGVAVQAKLDTGADASSLNAAGMEEFERGGKKWVRFEVASRIGRKSVIEVPLISASISKKKGAAASKRKLVRLGVCLGKVYLETDLNLVSRSKGSPALVLGRGALAGNALVDAGSSYTSDPLCAVAPER